MAYPTSVVSLLLGNQLSSAASEILSYDTVDVFKLDVILLPFVSQRHCSLIVIVNPGGVINASRRGKSHSYPCILLFDSQGNQATTVKDDLARKVRNLLNKLWQLSQDDGTCVARPFHLTNMKLYNPLGTWYMRSCICNFTLDLTAFVLVPFHRDPCDAGVFLCRYVSSILVVVNECIISSTDLSENCASLISRSLPFKFCELDAYRIRSELYILVTNLAERYCSDRVPDFTAQLSRAPGNDHCCNPCETGLTRQHLPKALDFSFLSNVIEVGDLIEYRLRTVPTDANHITDGLVQRAIVSSIVYGDESTENNNKSTKLQLSNGDHIVGSLHLVRRVTLRCMYTGQVIYNPVKMWRELHEVYLQPTAGLGLESLDLSLLDEPSQDQNDNREVQLATRHAAADREDKATLDYENKCHQREQERMNETQCTTTRGLFWLSDDERRAELCNLNKWYQQLVQYGEASLFGDVVKSLGSKNAFSSMKKLFSEKIRYRTKVKKIALIVAAPLIYFSFFISSLGSLADVLNTGTTLPTNSTAQTVREFKRREEILKFERKMFTFRVRTCVECKENHLKETDNETSLTKEYKCAPCNRLQSGHYLSKNLHPVWYEHNDDGSLKFDGQGNRITRFDIPVVLSSLTIAEKLLIRRTAPYIPSVHLTNGTYGIKGHCIAFPQNISSVCNELPQKKETIVSFVRQMGNKNNTGMKLSCLKVRKRQVLDALKFLSLHHSGYKDITIKEENLNWMQGKPEASIQVEAREVNVTDERDNNDRQFVSSVQCAGDTVGKDELEFHTTHLNDVAITPNSEQSSPIHELTEVLKQTNQMDKLMRFPEHGDTPVKCVSEAYPMCCLIFSY